MTNGAISLLPHCDTCGVEYAEDYEGPCQEPRGTYHEYSGWSSVCPGTVSWRATAALLIRAGSAPACITRSGLSLKSVEMRHGRWEIRVRMPSFEERAGRDLSVGTFNSTDDHGVLLGSTDPEYVRALARLLTEAAAQIELALAPSSGGSQ